MVGYIDPPKKVPLLLRFGIWITEKKLGRKIYPARILSWYPKAALGAGVMEGLIAHSEGKADERLLKLVRMQVSFLSSCPFCIDMNSFKLEILGINEEEIRALQGIRDIDDIKTFSSEEKIALKYACCLTRTPISVQAELLKEMLTVFSRQEFVVIVSTVAQVNYWTRMIQGIGVPPAGFSSTCSVLNLENYQSLMGNDEERQ